jgi:C4-dicarboxylate transporter DctQ subunit
MSGHSAYRPKGVLGQIVHDFEETAIAVLLGLMTLLTFVNVILRYIFNSMVIWGLEVVLILFAWLVLFGIAYGFKITAHLGVDAVTNLAGPKWRRIFALIAAVLCIVYALLMLKGAWDYWAPFAGMDKTTGRWFPTGFDPSTRDQAFFETDQVPMLGLFRFLEDLINQGETYSKLPRVIPYTMLPVAGALMLLRIVQATIEIVQGKRDSLIVSHEAEDAVAEAQAEDLKSTDPKIRGAR